MAKSTAIENTDGLITAPFDVASVRAQFPILSRQVHGKPLAFLDSAASAQKPKCVIDSITHTYEHTYANVHRGVHLLSAETSEAYEAVREKTRAFINAAREEEIIFTSGTTAAINMVAQTWGRANLGEGDEILITEMEHHSNIVPWQILCEEKGCVLRVIPIDDDGNLVFEKIESLLGPRTKLVAITQVSNALGTVVPVKAITEMAHHAGALVLIDGAQGVPHTRVDVIDFDCDFYAFSGHKLYGPTGTGVLYGKFDLLQTMPPWQGGGDMIRTVSFDHTEYADPPYRFEAGTPNIAGVIGLGAAIDWFSALDMPGLEAHEADLMAYGTEQLSQLKGLKIIGNAPQKAAVISFMLDYAHPHDIGTILDGEGVAIRTGHHCAQPVMDRLKIPATARASFGVYTNRADIDALVGAIGKVRELFG
ncbi:MAG: cysteine desulfurase [Alphaproteobacteria bacterium]|jgi:cysteine desulfurase/selenocysteine lyase